jgi:hypothetical protein
MIVDGSNFNDRPYRIPNQDGQKDFNVWLDKREKEICNLILGRALTKELLEALDSSSLETRFENLINGEDGNEFEGLKSVLVPSIYSRYVSGDSQFKLTMAGMVTNQPVQNSTVLDNAFEFEVIAWNDFVKRIGCVHTKDESTLWFYMNAHKEDFPSWKFTPQKFKNRFFH